MAKDDNPKAVYWLDNSLYLNITNKCSNNCWFCFRNFKKGVGGFNLKHAAEPALEQILSELEGNLTARRWTEVVFCGFGESTQRLDLLLEVARWIKKRAPTLTLRLDTNGHGYVLNPNRDVAGELKAAGIDKVSVSLNGNDEETYAENCRPVFNGGFQAVTNFVKQAKAAGLDVEVSAIRMPEVNLKKVKTIVDSLGASFRIRDYIPCFS
ncbi:MAG: TatD family nuclease-associated radical SAM protein [Candidatus Bathyarchaeota archaeon]|nr:TatD family nuclease-associated radical SAM protein [Candidatus Bathyarchaeota archaeon]